MGPEFYGQSAIHSNSSGQTGFEGLMTARLEQSGDGLRLRFRLGIGHCLAQNFGTPEWRVLLGVELFYQRPNPVTTPHRRQEQCNNTGTKQITRSKYMPIPEFLLRLGAALLLGSCVGLERQWRQRMAGTRTNALVAAGAAAFVMCAYMVRDNSRGEAQIVSYVVSGIGFLGAGVIFKDAGSVRGLNTAATIWCSAAIGAISGLGNPVHALILAGAVLITNIVLRPLAYRLYPAQTSGEEQEVTYGFELICRPDDEAHMRALLLQAMSRSSLTLTGLRSEDIEGAPKMKVVAQIKGLGRQDEALEQIVVRLSLEAGVSSVSWAVSAQVLE